MATRTRPHRARTTPAGDGKPLLSFSEAATIAGLSEATLRRLDRSGALAGIVIHPPGAHAYLRRAALLRWLDREHGQDPPGLRRAV